MKRKKKHGQRRGVPVNDDDDIVVICLPAYAADVIPGSTQRNCHRCAEPIWVSPGTLRSFADNPRRYFICMNCALKDKEMDAKLQPPTPQQIDELKKYLEEREKEES